MKSIGIQQRGKKSRRRIRHLAAMLAGISVMGLSAPIQAADVNPEGASGNAVTVTKENYSITADTEDMAQTTEHDGNLGVVYGGGNENNTKNSFGNFTTISGGTVGAVIGGISSSGTVGGNTVTIEGGKITSGVTGGVTFFAYGSETPAGDVTNNTVIQTSGEVNFISGGEVGYAYPANGSAVPDTTKSHFLTGGNATGNRVEIKGGTVTGGVTGGVSLTGRADNNTVEISGGKISGNITGGEVRYSTTSSSATGNTVKISGSPNLSGATLRGGVVGSADTPSTSTSALVATNAAVTEAASTAPNTLDIRTSGITAKNISDFNALNIHLPENTSASTTGLTLTDSGTISLDGMDVTAGSRWTGGNMTGSTITLLRATNGTISAEGTNFGGEFYEGVTLKYPLTSHGLSADGKSYSVTLGDPNVNPNTKAVTQGVTTFHHIIHEPPLPDPDGWDYDMPTEDGSVDVEDHSADDKDEKPVAMSMSPFIDIGGGSMREKTGHGSYVDIDSFNVDAGIAFGKNNKYGRLVFAPIIDYGHGTYDTYLSNGVHGYGKARFTTGGLIARQINKGGFYYEGSIRAGRANVDFVSDEILGNDLPGDYTSFSESVPILAGHLRIGQLTRLTPADTLHVYGLYSHVHQGSMDAHLSSGEDYHFASLDNGRYRIGTRITHSTKRNQRFYTGLAYQYTKNDDASAVCNGRAIPQSGESGSSGMLELGWQIKPDKNAPMVVDVCATGWAGLQKGFTLQARIKRDF